MHAAKAGGEVVARFFGSPSHADYKGKFDPVTAVDKASEAAIVALLAEERPDDSVLAEEDEAGHTRREGRQWIIDPLDGTVNFVHAIPHVSVSVALYDDGAPCIGVVYDPLRDEIFTAASGHGSRLNGHMISVSATENLGRSVVATGFPYDHDERADELGVMIREVLRRVNGIRRFGSAALDLAWVASGRFDAYWEFGIAPWDCAAGLLLVTEATGTVTDPLGRPSSPFDGNVVASNGAVHEELRAVIESWMPMRLIEP